MVSCRNPYLYPVVVVALNTGMRKSEVLGLEWDGVNCGVLRVEETKNGSRRDIPTNQPVYDVLSVLPKEHLDQQDCILAAPPPRSLGFGRNSADKREPCQSSSRLTPPAFRRVATRAASRGSARKVIDRRDSFTTRARNPREESSQTS